MANLTTNFVGIKSPNPFWLASAPPTDKEYNVVRAFKAGWGGVVWKTLGPKGPPVVNVNGPRYGAIWGADRRLLGLNNIELITDRPLEVNLQEIKGQTRLPRPRDGRVADGPVRGGIVESHPALGRRNRRRRDRTELSAAPMACPNAAWGVPWAKCPNISKWSPAGANRTPACP
jgi:hypothetical protein